MIASFFQSLDARRVEYLLISGQATVLYGAATFSEDIDLWINPTRENCDRLAEALRACGACHYTLTPPLTAEHLQHGHGLHYGASAAKASSCLRASRSEVRGGQGCGWNVSLPGTRRPFDPEKVHLRGIAETGVGSEAPRACTEPSRGVLSGHEQERDHG